MESKLCFVQFLHPRGEHKPDDGFIKKWNKKGHQRKFLRQAGKYIADGKVEKGEMVFWGEWEPESKAERIENPITHGPDYICKPYYVVPKSYDGLQNTDPFVFGKQFHYTVCLQRHFPQLRHLSRGSVILFGSCEDHAFVLDTVFVVGDHQPIDHTRANYGTVLAGAISQEYEEVAISPLYGEPLAESKSCSRQNKSCTSADAPETWRLYFGASYDKPVQDMYSFFPCQPHKVKSEGFPRPKIDLPQINPQKCSGVKYTGAKYQDKLSPHEIKSLWDKVVGQVKNYELDLGVYANMPERCTDG